MLSEYARLLAWTENVIQSQSHDRIYYINLGYTSKYNISNTQKVLLQNK